MVNKIQKILFTLQEGSFLLNRHYFIFCSCTFVLILAPLVISFLYPFYTVPFIRETTNEKNFYSLDDSAHETGRSKIAYLFASDSELIAECILKSGYEYPFAGIGCNFFGREKDAEDLSGYDYLKLRLFSSHDTNLVIEFRGGVQKWENGRLFYEKRRMDYKLPVKKGLHTYKIPLEDFTIPRWWQEANKELQVEKKDVIPAFGHVERMGLMVMKFDSFPGWEEKTTSVFHEVSFYKSKMLFYLLSFFFALCSLAVMGLLSKQSKKSAPRTCYVRKSENIRNIEYKKVELSSYKDESIKKIETFISENYSDADLSIRAVQYATGISPRNISRLIKDRYGMTFKQFINHLRISEAKRLLRETDINITEIAYEVGYNNLSNFYRVFKEIEKAAPGQVKKAR